MVQPYGANRTWLLLVGVLAYAVLVLVAFALLERRDLGAGVLPSRPGPARGSLRTVGGLTRRLARGTLIGWTVGFVVLGAVVGSLGGSVQSFVDSPEIADMLRKLGGGVRDRSPTPSSPPSCASRRSAPPRSASP